MEGRNQLLEALALTSYTEASITMETGDEILDKFKRQPFGAGMLPFQGTLRSLDTPFPRIYAQQDGRQRWVVCSVIGLKFVN